MMDYDLAPYVAKSYVRNVALYLEAHGYSDCEFLKENFVKPMDEYIARNKHVINDDGYAEIKSVLHQILPHSVLLNEESELFDFVLKKTERDVYQSMEATVHNLCSLACLHPLQEFWVYDRLMKQWCIYTAQEFHRAYVPHRFCALSFNKDTGEVEAQEITGVTEHDNTKPVYYIQDKTGTGMMVTNDHRCLTITDDGQYEYVPAEDLEYTVYPRAFKIPTTVDWEHEEYDVSVNSPRRRQANSPYPHDTVKYSTTLAELMGYYVGDGAMARGDSWLQFCVDVKVSEEKLIELFREALGITPKTHVYYLPRLNDPTVKAPMTVWVYVGVHVSRMFERLCGRGAENKHVPDFVLHGSHEIQNAFLKSYLTCDGCRTKKYIEFSTVSRFLILDLKLLFLSRGELLISSCDYKTDGTGVSYGMNNRRPLYTGRIGTLAAKRLGLADSGVFAFREDITFEIPRYDSQHLVKYIKDAGVPWGPLPRLPRSNPYKKGKTSTTTTRYHNVEQVELPEDKREHMQRLLKSYRVPVKKKVNYGPVSVVYDIEVANNHNFMLASGAIVHNSRAGSQVPFSSVNFGTDTSEEGRMVSRNLMLALDAGLGAGETAIFPISIFKLKKGINRAEGEPNYDLFKLACKVSAKRLFPKQHWGNYVVTAA